MLLSDNSADLACAEDMVREPIVPMNLSSLRKLYVCDPFAFLESHATANWTSSLLKLLSSKSPHLKLIRLDTRRPMESDQLKAMYETRPVHSCSVVWSIGDTQPSTLPVRVEVIFPTLERRTLAWPDLVDMSDKLGMLDVAPPWPTRELPLNSQP